MDFEEIRKALEGRKGYICLFLYAIVATLGAEGIIDGQTMTTWQEWITLLGGATVLAKANRLGAKVGAQQ